MRHRFTVGEEDRLDRLIAAHTPLSRHRARTLIQHGGVRVDGGVANAPWHKVAAGSVVELRTVAAPDRIPELPERYRDRDLLVVDKPAGLPAQPTSSGDRLHVYGIVSAREGYAGLHHRLDTPASGLLLLTLRTEANVAIAKAFREHTITRRYLAVVLGDPGAEGTWDAPLDEEQAITRWKRKASGAGMSLLSLQLETGRTHQIRRHAADAGAPLLGDRRYGGAAGRAWPRLALHAEGLAFAHPMTGQPLDITSPTPDDLVPLLARVLGSDAAAQGAAPSSR